MYYNLFYKIDKNKVGIKLYNMWSYQYIFKSIRQEHN